MPQAELNVHYDAEQRRRYEARSRGSVYWAERYPLERWRGTYKHGRFPEVAVRVALKSLGFQVLMSDPGLPGEGGFILTHYAAKRRKRDEAFLRMFNWFSEESITELNRQCDATKREQLGHGGGGDPDLFVFNDSGDRFFVEVKDKDRLTQSQEITFPRIASILSCDVLIARVVKVAGARPGDGLRLASRPVNTTNLKMV